MLFFLTRTGGKLPGEEVYFFTGRGGHFVLAGNVFLAGREGHPTGCGGGKK